MTNEATVLLQDEQQDEQWKPLAQIAILDEALRADLSQILRDEGWAVVAAPTGYHLLQNVPGLPFTDETWWKPSLIVADAFSPGCAGLTIALGLKDLGWSIPALLIANTPAQLERVNQEAGAEPQIFVARPEEAHAMLLRVARGSLGGRRRSAKKRAAIARADVEDPSPGSARHGAFEVMA